MANISPYLIDAPSVIPASGKRPLCNVPALSYGNKPADDGNLVLTEDERHSLLAEEPQAERFLRPYVGAKEYLNGRQRWCIWLLGVDASELDACSLVAERVRRVRSFREASSAKDTRKRADSPHEFFRTPVHDIDYMALPRTSSERREHLPIGFFGADTIPSDSTSVIANATPYLFGVLSSRVHMAWVRVVAGHLESRYRYSGDVVYNNFPWPQATRGNMGTPVEQLVAPAVCERVEECAHSVIAARENHPTLTLAQLYDPDKMPHDLRAAHLALDAAAEEAYDVDFGGDEERTVAHLLALYAELTGDD